MTKTARILLFAWTAFIGCPLLLFANDSIPQGRTQVTAAIQHESLFPTTDISADRSYPRAEWAKIDHLSNSYADLGVRYEHYADNAVGFTGVNAALRLELMQWPLLGYEANFRGYGIGHLHVATDFRWGRVTLGDVYGQFGSGLILRLYEERTLGIDNALRGAKIEINPYKGIHIDALGGKQRRYWNMYQDHAWGFNYTQDAVLGANLELQVDEWSPRMQEAGANLLIGGSFVSKYDAFDTISYNCPTGTMLNVPEWVGAGDVRANFQMKGWNALIEYAYKANDPSNANQFSYSHGDALLASLSYSQKGLSVIAQAKRSQNMAFRSDRLGFGNVGYINHLPAFTNQHTYALAALYPYATQMLGEWAMQGEVRYTWKRGTPMGGKYGTTLKLNASHVRGLGEKWYQSGDTYYTDVNLELNKKINKQWYIGAMAMYQTYNKFVVEGHGELIRSGIGVVDVKWATTKDVQMRAELQYLFTRQDEGQWIFALYEISLFKQLMLSVSEQYCIGRGTMSKFYAEMMASGMQPDFEPEQGNHYYSFLATWTHDSHRLSLGYNKTRAGFNCSGGVCRYVPKQEGVVLTYNYSF